MAIERERETKAAGEQITANITESDASGMHKRTCSRNLNELSQCVRTPLRRSQTPCDPRTTDFVFPQRDERVRMKINPNFSRDQLDRVDWGRTNRDMIAKSEQ